MTKEQDEQEAFRVTDKRGFQENGEVRSPDAPPETPKANEEKAQAETPPEVNSDASKQDTSQVPSIDFPSYLLSYYTQGLVLLGEVPSPYSGKKEEDIEAARHTVDILAMLQEKTKGNLGKDEEQLLENVLYELRMKYMAKTNRIKT